MENENQMEAAKAMEIAEDVLTELCMDWSPEILAMKDEARQELRNWIARRITAGYAAANEWVRIVPKEVSKIQLRDGTHIYLDHEHGGWRLRSTRLGIDDELVYTTLGDALDVVREKQSEMAELGYAEYESDAEFRRLTRTTYQSAPQTKDGGGE